MREVLFVAGEASGDLHAGGVAEVLKEKFPELPMTGIGGDHMRRAGVELLEHVDRLAVMGFVEVLQHIPKHWALLAMLKKRLDSGRVGVVVLLDYPGFNMKVAEAASRAGVPVLYYITPQVWAWGQDRLKKLSRIITRAACILPFEEPLLRKHGIDAHFVGHPLLDRACEMPSALEARHSLGLAAEGPVLAVFPGSRRSEIARHLEPFVEAASEVQRRRADVQVVVSVAPTVDIASSDCPFPLVRSAPFVVQRAATAGLLKSGTNTLEAAVAGLPHVIGYRTSPITFAIARRVVKIPYIGLVNVVAGELVSPEFIQNDFKPPLVADAILPLLEDGGTRRAAAASALSRVRDSLGSPGAAGRVAEMVTELLGLEVSPKPSAA